MSAYHRYRRQRDPGSPVAGWLAIAGLVLALILLFAWRSQIAESMASCYAMMGDVPGPEAPARSPAPDEQKKQ